MAMIGRYCGAREYARARTTRMEALAPIRIFNQVARLARLMAQLTACSEAVTMLGLRPTP